jgi:hypothetical protein
MVAITPMTIQIPEQDVVDLQRRLKHTRVKTSGLRWVSMHLLVRIPWAARVWALPFLTVLAPSERYHQERGVRHKKLTDWGRQMVVQLRRWLPPRQVVVVADRSYAVLELLARCARVMQPVSMMTRLRLDAALYDPAPARDTRTVGRPRCKEQRQPTLAQRLTDPALAWQRVTVPWYGGTQRVIEVTPATAVWYHSGMTPVAIRWVLIRDPDRRFPPHHTNRRQDFKKVDRVVMVYRKPHSIAALLTGLLLRRVEQGIEDRPGDGGCTTRIR